jgi:hypothetical protein
MLQSVEAKIGLARGFRVAVNGDHAAFLVELIKGREQGAGIREQGQT